MKNVFNFFEGLLKEKIPDIRSISPSDSQRRRSIDQPRHNNKNYQPYRRDNRDYRNNNRYNNNRRNYDRSPPRRRNYSPNRDRGRKSTRGRGYYPSNKLKDSVLDYYKDNRANETQILSNWVEVLELNLKSEDVKSLEILENERKLVYYDVDDPEESIQFQKKENHWKKEEKQNEEEEEKKKRLLRELQLIEEKMKQYK
eukprot:gene2269-2443_t